MCLPAYEKVIPGDGIKEIKPSIVPTGWNPRRRYAQAAVVLETGLTGGLYIPEISDEEGTKSDCIKPLTGNPR